MAYINRCARHINSLPDEVLLIIFQYYLETNSQGNFLKSVSNVCRKWKRLCEEISYFQSVDGSLPIGAVVRLAKNGYLKQTKELKFGRIVKAKNRAKKRTSFGGENSMAHLYSNLPSLKCLNLANVCEDFDMKMEHCIFTELKDFCPDLCELVLGEPDVNCKAAISADIFKDFLRSRGSKLVTLDLSHVKLLHSKHIFEIVASHCPNLEHLLVQDLSSNDLGNSFPITDVQKGCPKLKTLRLGFPILFMETPPANPVGFPNLETFTFPSRDDYQFRGATFEMILSKSPNLKVLDIRGCQLVSAIAMESLPAAGLEQLYLAKASIGEGAQVAELLWKWRLSLKVLDLSHTKGDFINLVLGHLNFPNGLPELEFLDVSGSTIETSTLKHILARYPKLQTLHLEGCRYLRRGVKRVYESRSEIQQLLAKINAPLKIPYHRIQFPSQEFNT